MSILYDFQTIPEVYEFLTTSYKRKNEKPVFKQKIDGKYCDISYNEFRDKTKYFALGLASIGIKRGAKVALISENRPEWVYTDYAVLSLGAVDVPLYPILTADTIEFIMNNSGATAIVVSNKFQMNKVLKVWSNCKLLKHIIVMNNIEENDNPGVLTMSQVIEKGKTFGESHPNYLEENIKLNKKDDICTIIYTSGTTGEPKGVMLTHDNILSNVKGAHKAFDISDKDTFLSFLPTCHIYERMSGYYAAMASGATIAYAESIEKVAFNLVEIKPTIMTAVPRLFERMYNKIIKNIEIQSPAKQKLFGWAVEVGKKYQLAKKSGTYIPIGLTAKQKLADKLVLGKIRARTGGKLRFFISGGAALARELAVFFEATGILVIEGYGLTESSPIIAVNRPNDYKFGTVGKVLPGVEVKIAKDGEILACGPGIMQGYHNNKRETEAVLVDGWLHTGDIGVFDAEGFLIITDRKKHLFKTSGGKYVAPQPIENMFLTNRYIEQFVLIGDKRMFITALIVPDFEALKEYADANRIQYEDEKNLVKMKQINELLDKEFANIQRNLSAFERVRKFTLLDKPFTIEDGELTPKLSVKRKVIEERYKDLIEDMYQSLGS
ncbi:MAG: long-chain fatty acid--CoA ligase [Ignavibacteria bacterium]|jgi:long-chain acyl-CoA synthetase